MAKRKKPELGEIIEVNFRPTFSAAEGFTPHDAEVVDLLNVQFIARVIDGTDVRTFRFYDDLGNSWRFKKDDPDNS